jgi:ribonuclease HI
MKYYFDGFTLRRNPSPIGGGYTIVDDNNTLIKVENIKKIGLTNNEAELRGLLGCLEVASKGDILSTDSFNTISWIRTLKDKKIARKDLLVTIRACRELMEEKEINLIWEGRDYNLAGIYNEENKLDSARISVYIANDLNSKLK